MAVSSALLLSSERPPNLGDEITFGTLQVEALSLESNSQLVVEIDRAKNRLE